LDFEDTEAFKYAQMFHKITDYVPILIIKDCCVVNKKTMIIGVNCTAEDHVLRILSKKIAKIFDYERIYIWKTQGRIKNGYFTG
jgi:hypothetical protein